MLIRISLYFSFLFERAMKGSCIIFWIFVSFLRLCGLSRDLILVD
jgi:hypothetical protein